MECFFRIKCSVPHLLFIKIRGYPGTKDNQFFWQKNFVRILPMER